MRLLAELVANFQWRTGLGLLVVRLIVHQKPKTARALPLGKVSRFRAVGIVHNSEGDRARNQRQFQVALPGRTRGHENS